MRGRLENALAHIDNAIVNLERMFYTISRDSSRVAYFAKSQEIFDHAILLSLQLQDNEKDCIMLNVHVRVH